jgi:hypothetical protein
MSTPFRHSKSCGHLLVFLSSDKLDHYTPSCDPSGHVQPRLWLIDKSIASPWLYSRNYYRPTAPSSSSSPASPPSTFDIEQASPAQSISRFSQHSPNGFTMQSPNRKLPRSTWSYAAGPAPARSVMRNNPERSEWRSTESSSKICFAC